MWDIFFIAKIENGIMTRVGLIAILIIEVPLYFLLYDDLDN